MSHPSTLSLSPQGAPSPFVTTDVDGLERHMHDCSRANGVWHAVRCKAEAADSFLSGRIISTIVIAASIVALFAYW